ncbi:MAG TPA: tetraacyldisaccharide 4'-kinase, partial [Terriglobia bacterium]|nr:tetraacyldisaccharide 4'-kinase [Terriglobia bacterium]
MTQPAETKNRVAMGEREPQSWRNPSLVLLPLAEVFHAGVALRHAAYRHGWIKKQRLARPVISVGNLTVGGTGKTPLVAWIARRLMAGGHRPSILTRGYGRRRGPKMIVLEPRAGRAAHPREVGDEPAWLARQLPEVPIIVAADRYEAGHVAEERFRVDVHLLDDGFSHLPLARDIDIVTLDSTIDLRREALLPAGRLREPYAALARADLIVLTRAELADPARLEELAREGNPRASIFHSRTKLCRLVELPSGLIQNPENFKERSVYAFCGLGNPAA